MRVVPHHHQHRQRGPSLGRQLALLLAFACALWCMHSQASAQRRRFSEAAHDTPFSLPWGHDAGWRSSSGGAGGRTVAAAGMGGGGSDGTLTAGDHMAAAADAVRGASIAFVTFGNGVFSEFIENWVAGVRGMGLPFLIGALDGDMASKAAAQGWPHMDVSALVNSNASFFRANFTLFRNMGATKVQLVLTMLEDLEVQTVVVSDSDAVWLHNPADFFDQHLTADWFISTDCLSHETEVAWQPKHNNPRCGHIPGNGWGRAFNTGVFAVRNRKAAREMLALWRDLLLDPSRSVHVTRNNVSLGITDQLALNLIIEEGKNEPFVATPEDPRVLLLRNGTLRLCPLPALLFPSGHVAFVQRLPWRHGVDPYVVHATFQRYNLYKTAKRARFREFGMWFLDGAEYYAADKRYLTYENDVVQLISGLRMERFPAGVPLLYRHLIAVEYQLALYRDALAAAMMLNRTLVLPKSWCWCDLDWTPHVLEKCKIRGTDLELPFECPADFIFHIPFMENRHVDFRMPGFLDNTRLPGNVRRSHADMFMLPEKPQPQQALADAGGAADSAAAAAEGRMRGALWPGMSEAALRQAEQPLNGSSVITIRDMRPGLVAGFADAAATAAFDELFTNITHDAYWCCAAETTALIHSAFYYKRPEKLAAGPAPVPWKVPELPLPDYCDKPIPPKPEANDDYMHYPNHPCQFLRNETAARIAAALA